MSRSVHQHPLVVDGMNVIGSRPTGWWRDPDAAKRALVDRLARLAGAERRCVLVVFDGRPMADLPEGEHRGVEVRYAERSGPDAADDRIVRLVDERDGPLVVVTSDRGLRDRLTGAEAEIEGASWLLRRLDRLDADGGKIADQ